MVEYVKGPKSIINSGMSSCVTSLNANPYICPGIYPVERRAKEDGEPWYGDVSKASYEGGHIVLDVQPGGSKYSISYLTAADESMTVRSVMKFDV